MDIKKTNLSFECQLAHGSSTNTISGFTKVGEIYKKIADCYGVPVSEILFVTLNSNKIDMSNLLGNKVMVNDFIYAHVKGRTKDITLTKSDEALGITVTDNGAGYAFIKGLKNNTTMDKHPSISVGDHIEQIDKQSMVGMKHIEVAKVLKDIPVGTTFRIYLVEPKQSVSTTTSSEPSQQSTTSEHSHSKAQVLVPAVDLTGDKSCNSCQVNDLTSSAVVYCKACREFYCPSCRDCHKAFRFTRDHVLAMLTPKHVNDSELKQEENTSDSVTKSKRSEEENSSDVDFYF